MSKPTNQFPIETIMQKWREEQQQLQTGNARVEQEAKDILIPSVFSTGSILSGPASASSTPGIHPARNQLKYELLRERAAAEAAVAEIKVDEPAIVTDDEVSNKVQELKSVPQKDLVMLSIASENDDDIVAEEVAAADGADNVQPVSMVRDTVTSAYQLTRSGALEASSPKVTVDSDSKVKP